MIDHRGARQPGRGRTFPSPAVAFLLLFPVVLLSVRPCAAGSYSGTMVSLPLLTSSEGQHLTVGEGVLPVVTSIPSPLDGADVAEIIGADRFYDSGFTGQGSRIANIEAGLAWNGHETLTHVTQYLRDASAWDDPGTPGEEIEDLYDRHATWTGSLIAGRAGGLGNDALRNGIAYNSDLWSGAVASEFTGTAYTSSFRYTIDSLLTPYLATFGSVDVISSSWGQSDQGAVNDLAFAFDGLADQFPTTTFVAAAGNGADPDRDPATPPITNSVIWPANGYNSIAVAALANNGSNVYDSVASFSSRGPQDWAYADFDTQTVFVCTACRAGVDLAAPGTNLTLAYYGGATGGNNPTLPSSPAGALGGPDSYFSGLAGTSFSTPIVASGAALLASVSYNTPELAANDASRDARVIKALLQNSADKIPGWDNGQYPHPNGLGGVQTFQALDFASGAGALNLDRAFSQYLESATRDIEGTKSGDLGLVDSSGWDFGLVEVGTDNVYTIDGELPAGALLTATLTWFRDRIFDAESLAVGEVGSADLDLLVRDSITGELISESISGFNNVEHLHFALPRSSRYQIEVQFYGLHFGDLTSEEYGLAWRVTVPEPASVLMLFLGVCFGLGRRRLDWC